MSLVGSRAGAAAVAGTVTGAIVVVGAIAVVLLPLIVLGAAVFGLPQAPSFAALKAILQPQNLAAVRQTLVISLGAAAVAGALGLPLAVMVERTGLRGGRALGTLFALPLAIPPYLLAFAYRAAWDDRIGLIPWPSRVIVDIDSAAGVALVLGVSLLPIVLLRVRATLASIDGALEEAARTAGAGPLRALLDVTVPLVLPSAASAVALTFVAAAAAYGVPVLLGLAAVPPVVVVTARIAVALQGGGMPDALGLSVALTGLAGVAFTLPLLLGRGAAVVTGKASRPSSLDLGRADTPLALLWWSLATVLVLFPIAALLLQGLTLRAGDGLAWQNLGLHHVVDVLARPEVREATRTSAILALAAAAVIVVLAVVVVVARRRSRGVVSRGLRLVTSLMELSYALPGTVVAVAMVLTFSQQVRLIVMERVTFTLALGGTAALLLLAYVVKEAALGFRAVDDALDQLHPSLEEAARIAGAGPIRAFVDVTLPLLRGHLIAAAVAVALPCFTELTMSVLLQAPGMSTLGVVLFSLYEYGDPQEAMALAALLVVVALGGQGLIAALRRRR